MQNKEIKAIIFDAGRVLINYDNGPFYGVLEKLSPFSAEEIKSKLWGGGIMRDYHNGKTSPQEFYDQVAEEIKVPSLDFKTFFDSWRAIITTPNSEMEKVLSIIRPEISLLILSDNSVPHWEVIEKFDLIRKFFPDKNKIVLSFNVHVSKPDNKIYQEVLKRAGCRPEECIFVDDNEKNLEPFRALGGNVIHYNCRTNTIDELRNELVTYNVFK